MWRSARTSWVIKDRPWQPDALKKALEANANLTICQMLGFMYIQSWKQSMRISPDQTSTRFYFTKKINGVIIPFRLRDKEIIKSLYLKNAGQSIFWAQKSAHNQLFKKYNFSMEIPIYWLSRNKAEKMLKKRLEAVEDCIKVMEVQFSWQAV